MNEFEVLRALETGEENLQTGFFNHTTAALHVPLMQLLVSYSNQCKSDQLLQKAYDLWRKKLLNYARKIDDPVRRNKYAAKAKLLAACLIASDQHFEAAAVLADAVQLNSEDLHTRILLLYCLCFLGLWKIVAQQLKRERSYPTKMKSAHYTIVLEIIENLVTLHENNNEQFVDEVTRNLLRCNDVLMRSSEKTYIQYEGQVLIRLTFAQLGHQPNANLAEIGDPLYNLDITKARYETLVKCRQKSFFRSSDCPSRSWGGLINDDSTLKESNIGKFLELQFALAGQFNAVSKLCHEYLVAGVLRECESEACKLWQQSYKMANIQSSLSAVNILHLTASMDNDVHTRLTFFQQITAAFLNINTTTVSVLLNSLQAKEAGSSSSFEGDASDRKCRNGYLNEASLNLPKHGANCPCIICIMRRRSPYMQMECLFSIFLCQNFSSKAFGEMCFLVLDAHQIISAQKAIVEQAMQVDVIKDSSSLVLPRCFLELFLMASVQWLRSVGREEKTSIRDEVIRRCIEFCSKDFLNFRWQYLTIRQAVRPAIPPLDLYWIHSVGMKTQVERLPLSSVVNNLVNKFSVITLSSHAKSGMTSRKAENDVNGEKNGTAVETSVSEARNDLKNFGHLFYRDWRFQTSSYLLAAWSCKPSSKRNNWEASYYMSEATCIGTRQLARMLVTGSEKRQFHFEDVDHFKKVVQKLPNDLTVVQLFLDANRLLWLSRLHNGRDPLVVPLARLTEDDPTLVQFKQILVENDDTGNMGRNCDDPKKFWIARRRVDCKLKSLLCKAEEEWFGIFRLFLLPCRQFTDLSRAIATNIKKSGVSESCADALADHVCLEKSEWLELTERFASLEGSRILAMRLLRERNRWTERSVKSLEQDTAENYVVFCVPPELASFPFELLPVMQTHTRVCRIPSFHLFQQLLNRSKKIPKTVDGSKTFYVLDPGGDLTQTQNRLLKKLREYSCWKGKVGEPPTPEELRSFLETNDLFFYAGHGSGGRYFGRKAVLRSDCRAVSLLMGCSSVRITRGGGGFDGKGSIYDYMIAKCPCVVGCLWMVTDGEIDRVFLAILEYCFSLSKRKTNSGKKDEGVS